MKAALRVRNISKPIPYINKSQHISIPMKSRMVLCIWNKIVFYQNLQNILHLGGCGRRIGRRLRQLQIYNYRELTCSRAALHHKQNCTQTLAIVLDWDTLSSSTHCENTLKLYKKLIIIIKNSINDIKLNCFASL